MCSANGKHSTLGWSKKAFIQCIVEKERTLFILKWCSLPLQSPPWLLNWNYVSTGITLQIRRFGFINNLTFPLLYRRMLTFDCSICRRRKLAIWIRSIVCIDRCRKSTNTHYAVRKFVEIYYYWSPLLLLFICTCGIRYLTLEAMVNCELVGVKFTSLLILLAEICSLPLSLTKGDSHNWRQIWGSNPGFESEWCNVRDWALWLE